MTNAKATLKWFCLLAIAGVLTIYSCKKETTPTPTPVTPSQPSFDSQSSEDQALADNSADDMNSMADEAVDGNLSSYKNDGSLLGGCATVTKDSIVVGTTKAFTVTIDFGTAGTCQSPDGRYRKGKVIITFTGKYREPNTVITIVTQNYYVSPVNDNNNPHKFHQIIGARVVTNGGVSLADSTITIYVSDSGRVIKSDGGIITWQSSRTRKWKGYLTPFYRGDDTYTITGSANGVDAKGRNYSIVISDPLVRTPKECLFFKNGIITLTSDSSGVTKIFEMDFGKGDASVSGCDACKTALVTYAGDDDVIGTSDDKSKSICLTK